MLRRFVTLLAVVYCAGAAAQSMNQTPPRAVSSEKLATYWTMLSSSVGADVPNNGQNMQQPGCATVSFVVESNGTTSNIKVQRVVPEGDLGKVAASVAQGLRFGASAFNAGKQRVFSWLIFPFNLPADHAAQTAIMQKCLIKNLAWKDH